MIHSGQIIASIPINKTLKQTNSLTLNNQEKISEPIETSSQPDEHLQDTKVSQNNNK